MKKRFKKMIATVLTAAMALSVTVPAFAETEIFPNPEISVNESIQDAEIISIETIPLDNLDSFDATSYNNINEFTGLSEKSFHDEIPNLLQSTTRGIASLVTAGFSSCTDETITISLLNISTSSVRTSQFKLTVSGDAYTGPYSVTYNIAKNTWPIGLTNVTIRSNQITCSERLSLTGHVASSEGMFEIMEPADNHRTLTQRTLNQWDRGTFSTVENSLNYHFYHHQADTYIQPINTIVDYCQSAEAFLNTCIKQNIPGSYDPHRDPGVYKYVNGKVYVIAKGTLQKASGPIYSYGGN